MEREGCRWGGEHGRRPLRWFFPRVPRQLPEYIYITPGTLVWLMFALVPWAWPVSPPPPSFLTPVLWGHLVGESLKGEGGDSGGGGPTES